MIQTLQSINKVNGVVGTIVTNQEGNVLSSLMPDLYDNEVITEAVSYLCETIMLASSSGRNIKMLNTSYENGQLVLQKLDNGFLIVLCQEGAALPLLSMAMNLTSRKLSREISTGTVTAQESMLIPYAQAAPMRQQSNTQPVISEDESERIKKCLTTEVGPIASTLIKHITSKMGVDPHHVPKSRRREFIEQLSHHISDPVKRNEFVGQFVSF